MSVRFIPLANINGKDGAQGPQGPAGTFTSASGHTLPAGSQATVETSGSPTAKHLEIGVPRGLPGLNAVPTDEAMAVLVGAMDTLTGNALENRFVPKNSLVFNAADHGVVGDGTADDTATMQALIDQVPDGSTIVAPPGAVYRSAGWSVKGRTLDIDLSNAHLVKTDPDNEIFRAEGSFDAPVSVGGVITNQRYSRLVVADTDGFNAGDIVKVFSNDEIRDSRPRNETEKSWQGEFAVVANIDGTEVHVSPPLLDTYSTNIRVARIQNHRVSFRFGTADYDGNPGTEFTRRMFRYSALNGSYIAGHVVRGPGTAFSDHSCVYTVADLRVENLPAADGYGVTCGGSSWGDYRIVANRLRHAFTDDTAGRAATGQTDPAVFGRAMYCKITGSSARATAVPWDTHHGGYGHHFYDITATGTDARWLFRIRGRAHTLSDCIAIGAESGFGVMAEAGLGGQGTSYQHRFVNCATYRVGQPFNVAKDTLDDPAFDSVVIEGGYFEFFRQGPVIEYGYVRMVDPVLVFTEGPYEYDGIAFFNIVNGRLRGSCTLDATKLGPDEAPNFVFRGSTGPAGTNQIDVDVKLNLSDSARHQMQAVVQWNSMDGQVRAHLLGNHSMLPWWNLTRDASRQSVILTNSLGPGTAPTTAFRSITASGGSMIQMRSGDAVVTCRLNSSGSVTTAGIEPGAFSGQRLDLYAVGGSVTIPSGGAANTSLRGGDVTLQARESMSLVWDSVSAIWLQLS
ncbi:hypothetical protein [Microbacterium faecale]|nr:hypothetical protein [Microbacterium faecale]